MLNFLGQQVLSKPIEVLDVVKAKDARQQFRDLQRKSAIEQAKRDALKADGTLDQTKLRTTLIAQGFGENADELVNAVTKERETAAATESSALNRDYMDLLKGLITPDEFNRRHSGQTTVTSKPMETGSYDLMKDKYIPQENIQGKSTQEPVSGNEILVTGSEGKTSRGYTLQDLPEVPTQEYSTKTEGPQITPEYLKSGVRAEDLMPKTGEGISAGGSLSYQLPKESTEKIRTIEAAGTLLGTSFDKNDPEVQTKIDQRMSQIAESQVPELSPVSFNSSQEYFKYIQERPSKIAKAKADLMDKFEAARSSRVGQDFSERSTKVSEQGNVRAEKQAGFQQAGLSPETNPDLARTVQPEELRSLQSIKSGFNDMKLYRDQISRSKDGYMSPMYMFAAAKLKANNQPVTEDGILTEILGSGMVPSASELILKNAMKSGVPLKDLVFGDALKTAGFYTTGKSPNLSVLDASINNVKSDFKNKGGKVSALDIEQSPVTPNSSKGSVEKQLRDKSSKKTNSRESSKGR